MKFFSGIVLVGLSSFPSVSLWASCKPDSVETVGTQVLASLRDISESFSTSDAMPSPPPRLTVVLPATVVSDILGTLVREVSPVSLHFPRAIDQAGWLNEKLGRKRVRLNEIKERLKAIERVKQAVTQGGDNPTVDMPPEVWNMFGGFRRAMGRQFGEFETGGNVEVRLNTSDYHSFYDRVTGWRDSIRIPSHIPKEKSDIVSGGASTRSRPDISPIEEFGWILGSQMSDRPVSSIRASGGQKVAESGFFDGSESSRFMARVFLPAHFNKWLDGAAVFGRVFSRVVEAEISILDSRLGEALDRAIEEEGRGDPL